MKFTAIILSAFVATAAAGSTYSGCTSGQGKKDYGMCHERC